MTTKTDVEIVHPANDTDIQYVKDELKRFVENLLPPENAQNIDIVLKDKGAEIIGGILCRTTYNTLVVDSLWVAEQHRRKGLGTLLLESAETEAMQMGCTVAMTGTFEVFGARPFYQKHGFEIVTTGQDSPPGETGYWFHKKL